MIPKREITEIAKRFLVFATSRGALLVARWAILIALIKRLPTEEFAYIAAIMATCDILRAFSDLGTGTLIHAKLGTSVNALSNSLKSIIAFRIWASVVTSFLGAVIFFSVENRLDVLPLFALPLTTGLQLTSGALIHRSNHHSKIYFSAFISFFSAAIALISTQFLQHSIPLYVILLLLPDIVNSTALSFFAKKDLFISIAYSIKNFSLFSQRIKNARIKLAQGTAISILIVAYNRLDLLIILPLLGPIEQAKYSAVIRVLEPIYTIFSTISLSLLTELSVQSIGRSKALQNKIVSSIHNVINMRLFLAMCLSACSCAAVISEIIGFSNQIAITAAIIGAAIPIKALNSLTSSILSKTLKTNIVLQSAILNTFIIIIIAILLTPRMGIAGCAIAISLGEIFNGFFQRSHLRKSHAN